MPAWTYIRGRKVAAVTAAIDHMKPLELGLMPGRLPHLPPIAAPSAGIEPFCGHSKEGSLAHPCMAMAGGAVCAPQLVRLMWRFLHVPWGFAAARSQLLLLACPFGHSFLAHELNPYSPPGGRDPGALFALAARADGLRARRFPARRSFTMLMSPLTLGTIWHYFLGVPRALTC